MAASYALLNELLFESEFTDTALIASNIALFRQTMKQSYEQEIYMTQLYRAVSPVGRGLQPLHLRHGR